MANTNETPYVEAKVVNCGAITPHAPKLSVWLSEGFVEIDIAASRPCAMVPLEDLELVPGAEGSILCQYYCRRYRTDLPSDGENL